MTINIVIGLAWLSGLCRKQINQFYDNSIRKIIWKPELVMLLHTNLATSKLSLRTNRVRSSYKNVQHTRLVATVHSAVKNA